ncbi:hypothetical protein [Flavobacterium orientale]|uniref:Uncharacterized protein n=1 Tax=Flavobacterium orientale TaxID=1756020 RepID=A0A917D9M8_9FLAO|nr:hypothetical protein [Flavobacterium orientale]GGD14441.1 hypothetical protein GCM10011343_01890 [Flavobacterium orientale]
MIVVVFKYLTPKRFRGITLFPFVVLKSKLDKQNLVLLHHERIHLRQQLELLVVPFFIWYGIEFLIRLFQTRSRIKAYRMISFEQEAYENENDLDYLKKRSFWNFLNYLNFK